VTERDADARPAPGDVTRVLRAIEAGDREAAPRLLALLYDELRAIAGRQMRRQSPAHTFVPTDLVHEAYLRLMERDAPWESRSHFLCTAAKAMRSILVDHARARAAQKRGGERERVGLHEALAWFDERKMDVVALDEALERLGALDDRKRRLVELRFFAGLPVEQAAEVLGVSRATAEREWTTARAWLHREMARG
jgi:RNA polymerase sigma-70 factor (ECF subfamily)